MQINLYHCDFYSNFAPDLGAPYAARVHNVLQFRGFIYADLLQGEG